MKPTADIFSPLLKPAPQADFIFLVDDNDSEGTWHRAPNVLYLFEQDIVEADFTGRLYQAIGGEFINVTDEFCGAVHQHQVDRANDDDCRSEFESDKDQHGTYFPNSRTGAA